MSSIEWERQSTHSPSRATYLSACGGWKIERYGAQWWLYAGDGHRWNALGIGRRLKDAKSHAVYAATEGKR